MNFGIIADGNRRWARKHNCSISDGHKAGFLVLKDEVLPLLEKDPEVKSCVIYAFSTENWKRSPIEVNNLMKLFINLASDFLTESLERGYRIIHAGRKDRLPKKLMEKIQKAEKLSQKNKVLDVYLCLDYGAQDEIKRAVKKGGERFEKYLEIPVLDIVYRTGGERRLSNFCIWQSAYAEFFFESKTLPEVRAVDIKFVLDDFRNRNRRKGK